MLKVAKVIEIGGRRAIELPEDLNLNVDEVFLKTTADGLLIMTRNPWDVFHEGVQELSEDFMVDRGEQLALEQRDVSRES